MRRARLALLLVEGETEEEFYEAFCERFLKNCSKKVVNLHGNWNINKKIVEASSRFADNHANTDFDVYVCIDQERIGAPAFDCEFVKIHLNQISTFGRVFGIVATLTIESLFFLDIHGIYSHLRAQHSRRNPGKYKSFRSFTHLDLTKLFKQFGKQYQKGYRCRGLVQSLDLKKLLAASELKLLLAHVRQRSQLI